MMIECHAVAGKFVDMGRLHIRVAVAAQCFATVVVGPDAVIIDPEPVPVEVGVCAGAPRCVTIKARDCRRGTTKSVWINAFVEEGSTNDLVGVATLYMNGVADATEPQEIVVSAGTGCDRRRNTIRVPVTFCPADRGRVEWQVVVEVAGQEFQSRVFYTKVSVRR